MYVHLDRPVFISPYFSCKKIINYKIEQIYSLNCEASSFQAHYIVLQKLYETPRCLKKLFMNLVVKVLWKAR